MQNVLDTAVKFKLTDVGSHMAGISGSFASWGSVCHWTLLRAATNVAAGNAVVEDTAEFLVLCWEDSHIFPHWQSMGMSHAGKPSDGPTANTWAPFVGWAYEYVQNEYGKAVLKAKRELSRFMQKCNVNYDVDALRVVKLHNLMTQEVFSVWRWLPRNELTLESAWANSVAPLRGMRADRRFLQ
jgi:hypothetical protein